VPGVVSLLADMTYEGVRSITGPYLAVPSASGAAMDIVASAGELIGYALRLASGHLSDRRGRHWSITILGYGPNLMAVPLLALAGRSEVAALLIVAERVGKAIRTPARDAILPHATEQVGRGRLRIPSQRRGGRWGRVRLTFRQGPRILLYRCSKVTAVPREA
jgi:MFS family permease